MSKTRLFGWITTTLAILITAAAATAQTTVYNAVPSTLVGNYPSLAFYSTSTKEFGDYVHLAGTQRLARSVTVTMSNWALQTDAASVSYCNSNPSLCTAQGYYHPFTLNFYNLGSNTLAGGMRDHGAKIGSITQTGFVPWRPAEDPVNCPAKDNANYKWQSIPGAPNTNCFNGLAFNITFDLTNSYIELPTDVIVAIEYNTQNVGNNPYSVPGPFNSLNVAVPTNDAVTAGTDDSTDKVFVNGANYVPYNDNGAAGVGVLREDGAWAPNGTIAFKVDAINAPAAQIVNVGSGSIANGASATQWLFYNDENDTISNTLGTFVTGPGTPPIGQGSAQISVSGSQRRNLATYQFAGTPLSQIGTLKFSTYNPSALGAPGKSGFMVMNIDFDGSDGWQKRLLFTPWDNGTVAQDTWQEWDAINGGNAKWEYSGATWPVGVGGGGEAGTTTKTWNQLLSQYPGIRIRVTDAHVGIRVGNPDPSGFTENIDAFKFGTASTLKVFNFDPLPTTVYVDDDWAGTPAGADPDGAGPATSFGYDSFAKIQDAINGVDAGGTINVAGGTYTEDVNVNKAGVTLNGAGMDVSTIVGPYDSGDVNTVFFGANSVTVQGFTITRNGNDSPHYATNPQNQGVSFAQLSSGSVLQNCRITHNRNGVYLNNTQNQTVRRNVIDDNRTGIQLNNDVSGLLVEENFITNNNTVGVLFNADSPSLQTSGVTIRSNNISGNWYGQLVDRFVNSTAAMNVSGNYFGTASVSRTTANSTEPGYPSPYPVSFGGSDTPPAPPANAILGGSSGKLDYSPYLTFGGDTQPGIPGFQGNYGSLRVTPDAAQSGSSSRVQEGVDLLATGGTLTIDPGSYAGNVTVNKAVNVKGIFTVGGSFAVTAAGAQVSPGMSPGIINTGNFSMSPGSVLNAELNGPNAGSQYDQVNVTGTVNLGGATLNATVGYTPSINQVFTIINNDGGDAVTGTFAGLPEGTVFSAGANTFRISYVGGTGNDVTLTAVSLCNAVSIPTNYTVHAGQQVDVFVNVDDTTGHGLYSSDFWLSYDPSVVTVQSASIVGGIAGAGTLTTNGAAGVLKVSIFNSAPFSGAGYLLKVTFNAVGAPGTSSAVSFTQFKFNEGTPCVSTSNGLVNIISGTITGNVTYGNAIGSPSPRAVANATLSAVGSVNQSATTDGSGNYSLSGFGSGSYTVTPSKSGDDHGAISGYDAAWIAQYVVGLRGFNADQATVADVSGTGGITSFDASLIARYPVQLPNTGLTGTWIFQPTSQTYPNVNSDITGQDYRALLMGDVTGNWNTIGVTAGQLTAGLLQKGVAVSMPTLEAGQGSTIDIPITIGDVAGRDVLSYDVDVTYDPTVLAPAEGGVTTKDSLSATRFITVNPDQPGHLRITTFGATPLESGGSLVNLRFNVIGGVGTETSVGFGSFQFNEGNVRSETVAGKVTVTNAAGPRTMAGRVLSTTGDGIANARVSMVDTQGHVRSVLTNAFGYYQVSDLTAGETFTVNVAAKRYSFSPRTVSITAQLTQLDLIADR